ncbi:Apelin receptor [Trichoplax sp. H2]|uniref:G-protein coupled receptors family 1 profile domain-containing protein n=1 Tax=Trichoplax adhaerens TaxID=10228 RepID=B3RWN0_TRIAD|nr:hypothetical protein TRIADDRAFT_56815 [Trichoplax adhaerens]EDV24725.1 hypothetical protein TRIADDRAFT_56815 [Trichoplax adhaerens]RDD41703.1 Apelin receptor [Trichoplax sp. H2]|eukprot:XP_002112615.1 hypothetical protein TRIADDRAFT_56815 [Trichoplax adhaerens]
MANESLQCAYSQDELQTDRLPVMHQWINSLCYIIIALIILFANSLVTIVLSKQQYTDRNNNENDSRKSFNLLMINLSVAGLLLDVLLLITPGYIIPSSHYEFPKGELGDFFCRLIDSEYFIHILSYTSLMIVTIISFKRWLAVARPHIFQSSVKKFKVQIVITTIWILQPFLCIEFVLGDAFVKTAYPPCRWKYVICDSVLAESVFFTVLEIIRFYFPSTLIILLTSDTARRMQIFQFREDPEMNRSDTRLFKRIAATAITAWLMVALCLPDQLYFTLSVFSVIRPYRYSIHSIARIFFITGSSCAPFMYSLFSPEFKLTIKKKCQSLRCNHSCHHSNRRRVTFTA